MPNIANKDGQVSVYGFMCGYIQTTVPVENVEWLKGPSVDLSLDGANYVVDTYESPTEGLFTAFDDLKKARAHFKSEVKRLGLKMKKSHN